MNTMVKASRLAFAAVVVLAACGCASSNKTTAAGEVDAKCVAAAASGNKPGKVAVNTVCPVNTNDSADETVVVVHKGKTIAFCCPGCVKKFNAMDEKGKDGVLKTATTYAK